MAAQQTNALSAGTNLRFDSAGSSLTVLGHIAYQDGLVRYRVKGDPDIECIDRFAAPQRERALLRIAPAEVVLKNGAPLYLGAEFSYLRSTHRAAVAAAGDLGAVAAFNGAIEEIEYVRGEPSAPGTKSLLCVAARGMTTWYLVLAANAATHADPAVLAARAVDARPGPGQTGRWQGDFLTLAMCAYFSLSLLHAYATRPSPGFSYWSECALALLLCEYFAAFATSAAVTFRKSVIAGRPEYFLFVMIGAIVLMALGVAARFLSEPLPILAFLSLLAGRIRSGLTVPADRIGELATQGAVAIAANLATLFTALFVFGTREAQVMAGALYFGLVGLFEGYVISRRYVAPA